MPCGLQRLVPTMPMHFGFEVSSIWGVWVGVWELELVEGVGLSMIANLSLSS